MTIKHSNKKPAASSPALILICRKSTGKQENSLDVQRSQAVDWAARNGREIIIDERYEATESGKVRGRESVAAALVEIKAGRAAGIIVTKLDRLGRSLEELLRIDRELRDAGGCLVVIKQAVDTSTPTGRLFFSILGSVAEFEREIICERVADTADELRRSGRHLTGKVPFGYQVETRETDGSVKPFLVPALNEQATIDIICELSGELSPGAIAAELNRRGITAKNGGKWHRTGVMRILSRVG